MTITLLFAVFITQILFPEVKYILVHLGLTAISRGLLNKFVKDGFSLNQIEKRMNKIEILPLDKIKAGIHTLE